MSNQLITQETVMALDKAVSAGLMAQAEINQFKKMFLIAEAVRDLKALLTPKIMEPIMNLQNTSLGFKADQTYGVDVVRDCIIEATLKGVYPVGNEFNIIARQCYITKEGYGHKLREIPNFTWMEVPGIPKLVGDNGALIKIQLKWTLNKQNFEQELELAIRVNKAMGTDAIIGKAIRKARAWLFTTVTGQEVGDGDADDVVDIKATEVNETQTSVFEQEVTNDNQDDMLAMN